MIGGGWQLAVLRYNVATQPGRRHDTDQCMRGLGAVRAAWAYCAHGLSQGVHLVHPTQFWTQCTVSKSLFGTLFMSTVHEVFKKNK